MKKGEISMKRKIQILLFFLLAMVFLVAIGSNQAFATEDYSLSIEPIDYKPQMNLMQRSVSVPSAVSDFENVQVEKYCYAGETFSLTAIIVPSNAYVGKVEWTIEQEYEVAKVVSQSGLTASIRAIKAIVIESPARAAYSHSASVGKR